MHHFSLCNVRKDLIKFTVITWWADWTKRLKDESAARRYVGDICAWKANQRAIRFKDDDVRMPPRKKISEHSQDKFSTAVRLRFEIKFGSRFWYAIYVMMLEGMPILTYHRIEGLKRTSRRSSVRGCFIDQPP